MKLCSLCNRERPDVLVKSCGKCGKDFCIPCLLPHDAEGHPVKKDPALFVPVI